VFGFQLRLQALGCAAQIGGRVSANPRPSALRAWRSHTAALGQVSGRRRPYRPQRAWQRWPRYQSGRRDPRPL